MYHFKMLSTMKQFLRQHGQDHENDFFSHTNVTEKQQQHQSKHSRYILMTFKGVCLLEISHWREREERDTERLTDRQTDRQRQRD